MAEKMSKFEIYKRVAMESVFEDSDRTDSKKITRAREVLIVDDEEPLLLSIADGLSIYRKHFNLQTATNGADAVKVLKSSPVIDLVVTDLSMPKMDGFELLAYMNRNYPKIPVILMTAFGTPKIEEIVNNMGIFRYLEKPLDINIIAENIFAALKMNSSLATGHVAVKEEARPQLSFSAGHIMGDYKRTMP
ncbi:MAG: response regulator [Smithellaceae bacterium]